MTIIMMMATIKTSSINIINNLVNEADKTVNQSLTSPANGATLGSPNTAVLTIVEDELKAGSIVFETSSYTVAENVGTVIISAARTGGSTGAVSVSYATDPNGGTATAGRDYTAISGTLAWAAGEAGNKTFTLTILTDTEVEGAETVQLNLTNVTGGAFLGSTNTIVVTIEGPAVTVLDPWPSSPQFSRYGSVGSLSKSFIVSPGPNRLLLVAISNRSTSESGQTFRVTYGGKPLTRATIQNSSLKQTWIGYLKEDDIVFLL